MPQPERRLAIVGYGKMGRLIEQLAPEYGFAVALKLDEFNNTNYEGVTPENFRGIDVAVDFSIPSAVVENVERISALGVNIVVGTTGWTEHLARVKSAGRKERHRAGLESQLFDRRERLCPSGGGSGAAAGGAAGIRRLGVGDPSLHQERRAFGNAAETGGGDESAGYTRAIDVGSNRAGAHPGTHEIGFDSAADTITLRHTARSREGFARGALQAARWVVGKKGFHEFREILFTANAELGFRI